MKDRRQKLILEQVSRKLEGFQALAAAQQPSGWIHSIRTAINMSLSQLGKRSGKTPQGVRALEQREKSGAITLQSLREIAEAMDMQLVYAIVPKSGTLEDLVDLAAEKKAEEIVTRTSGTMELEDQQVRRQRLIKAMMEKREELKNEMPKFLWD
jgi:predicted DNA-binding mobile mystery protein A